MLIRGKAGGKSDVDDDGDGKEDEQSEGNDSREGDGEEYIALTER